VLESRRTHRLLLVDEPGQRLDVRIDGRYPLGATLVDQLHLDLLRAGRLQAGVDLERLPTSETRTPGETGRST